METEKTQSFFRSHFTLLLAVAVVVQNHRDRTDRSVHLIFHIRNSSARSINNIYPRLSLLGHRLEAITSLIRYIKSKQIIDFVRRDSTRREADDETAPQLYW